MNAIPARIQNARLLASVGNTDNAVPRSSEPSPAPQPFVRPRSLSASEGRRAAARPRSQPGCDGHVSGPVEPILLSPPSKAPDSRVQRWRVAQLPERLDMSPRISRQLGGRPFGKLDFHPYGRHPHDVSGKHSEKGERRSKRVAQRARRPYQVAVAKSQPAAFPVGIGNRGAHNRQNRFKPQRGEMHLHGVIREPNEQRAISPLQGCRHSKSKNSGLRKPSALGYRIRPIQGQRQRRDHVPWWVFTNVNPRCS
jgi:hypothetical protein